MRLGIDGLGIISRIGRVRDLERLLRQSEITPGDLGSVTAGSVDLDGHDLPPQLSRRMSHFARLSLASACEAVADSGLDIRGRSVGIIQGSVYGPIISGLQALDDLIDYGDNQLSPAHFTGSVYNTSATYLSLALGLQGPTLSHTGGLDTLYNSLLTAFLWLAEGGVDAVIVGVGDEYAPFFAGRTAEVDRRTGLGPTAEGWVTLIVSQSGQPKYGTIRCETLNALPKPDDRKTIYSDWHEAAAAEEFAAHAGKNRACFPVWLRGSYPTACAFDLALALIAVKTGRFPVQCATDGTYAIQALEHGERVICYSGSEDGGLFSYEAQG